MAIPDEVSDGVALEDLDLDINIDIGLELNGVLESHSSIQSDPCYGPEPTQDLQDYHTSQETLYTSYSSKEHSEPEQVYHGQPSLIVSHLLESAFYIIFHGPSASPLDVIIQTNTMAQSLCSLIPSVFNPEYLKVSHHEAEIDILFTEYLDNVHSNKSHGYH